MVPASETKNQMRRCRQVGLAMCIITTSGCRAFVSTKLLKMITHEWKSKRTRKKLEMCRKCPKVRPAIRKGMREEKRTNGRASEYKDCGNVTDL